MVMLGYATVPTSTMIVAGAGKPNKSAAGTNLPSAAQPMIEGGGSSTALAAQGSSTAGGQAAAAAAPAPKRPPLVVGSPNTVTTPSVLAAAAAAAAAASQSGLGPSGTTSPLTSVGASEATTSAPASSAASSGRRAASPRPQSPSPPLSRSRSPTRSYSQSDSRSHGSSADLQAAVAAAAAAAAATGGRLGRLSIGSTGSTGSGSGSQRPSCCVDIPTLVARLKQGPLTGQVVAWGWEAAAALSAVRRTMPAQLFSALWPATDACAYSMMPQDVLELLESWLTLMQQCPRHFRLSAVVLRQLATYAVPAAVKRMGEDQLAQLAQLTRDIALHRGEGADIQVSSANQAGSSARDLMQPLFAAAAAETAWRCCNPVRYVSAETISAVVTAAPAWSWRVVRHRDPPSLAALKLATAAALDELLPHSPRDLPRSVLRKLKTSSPRLQRHLSA